MKSKSFDLKRSASEKVKQNKTFDFTGYYKTAAETKKAVENSLSTTENINNVNKFTKSKSASPSKVERTPNKKKNKLEPLDISRIDIEDPNAGLLVAKDSHLNDSKLTSTPQTSARGEPKVKSIMKIKSASNSEDYLDYSTYSPTSKPKKRNKSVSFMLDDTEELAIKKTKSNESIEKKPNSPKKNTAKEVIKAKKSKNAKKEVTGKENKKNDNVNSETSSGKAKKTEKLPAKSDTVETENETSKDSVTNTKDKAVNKKQKTKKLKKQSSENMEVTNESNNNEDQAENKNRKAKKKKHVNKVQPSETPEAEGEPAAKSLKKDAKPEAIVRNLESLSIGDNAHTLSNLLDEMTVVDKDKKKKNKQHLKKEKKTASTTPSTSSNESADLEKIEEGKEKIKWKKRKWNKDKKGDIGDEEASSTSVIVDNLPLSMVCDYKKVLADHFGKYGLIKRIGVAEVYPAEESKPIFTTTIQFYSEGAATEALAEDLSEVGGARVRVRRALPATQTTLVVRSYAALSDQNVSSAFGAAGRIRAIRHLVKGKNAIATAFVQFDGPESLSRALSLGAGARVGGKRVHAARFDPARTKDRDDSERHSETAD